MRFDSGRILQRDPQNAARCFASNSASSGPANALRTTSPAPGSRRSAETSRSGGEDGGATARKSPRQRRLPWNPPKRAERHVERLPRTTGTSIPPAAATIARAAPRAAAKGTTSPSSSRSTLPGDGPNEPPTTATSSGPDARDLERGRALGISDEPVREAQGLLVEGAGRGHAGRRPAVTSEVLDRRQEPGLQGEAAAGRRRSRNLTRSPGAKRKGGSARRSRRRRCVVPRRFQPPGVD